MYLTLFGQIDIEEGPEVVGIQAAARLGRVMGLLVIVYRYAQGYQEGLGK